jgi:PAS domain S-box-containing protein
MKKPGITAKILFPIAAFMVMLAVFAAVRTEGIIKGIMDDYHNTILLQERDEVSNLLNTGLPEDVFLEALRTHFATDNFMYRVTRGGRTVATCRSFPVGYRIQPDGSITAGTGDDRYFGYRIEAKKYGFVIDIIRDYSRMAHFERQLNSTVTIFSFSILLMLLYVTVVVRRNLVKPISNIMERISNGQPALPTNIRELDELGSVVNGAFQTAETKNVYAKTLHRIAVSLNEDTTLEDVMNTIIGQSKVLINAELSAIALYDEKGDFGKLKVYGLDEAKVRQEVKRMPRGEGILKLMKLSLVPVRINDIPAHPAFSGGFPDNHPQISNFLGYPLFSKEGKPLAAMYFANKLSGDFTVEDEKTLMAIASDAAVAIQRVGETNELRRFKKIIESSFDVVIITDRKGAIAYANPAFGKITGFSPADVVGKKLGILKSGVQESPFYDSLWNTILSGKPWKGEFVNRKKNGESYNASAVIFPVFSDSGEIANFVSIQRDITEEKKLQEHLVRSQKMEAIGTLAGGIAHDFNNLLSAVIGYAEILKDDLPEDHPHYRAVSIIESSAKRGADLAARILNVARKEKPAFSVVDVNSIICDTLELLSRSIPKTVSIVTDLKAGLPNVRADAAQIQQVIMNLAVNSRDAMPNGGRLLIKTRSVLRETVPGGAPEGSVMLSVSDTGLGMRKEIADKVFDPFFTTKGRGSGTGLGLYIVHSIVTNHGGYISLRSEPGKGTEACVYLPVCHDEAEEKKTAEEERVEEGGGTVLVIDDEPDVRELIRDVLERLGYTVIIAAEGREGIRIYRERRWEIGLVLLDVIMPGMNGSEVFQALRTFDPDVRVVLVSGYSSEGHSGIDGLLKSGVRGFIQKPFTQKTLLKGVRDHIKKQEGIS